MSALRDERRLEERAADRFPPEVYDAHDDVTPEAVKFMRERAKVHLAGKTWKKIDGVGQRKTI